MNQCSKFVINQIKMRDLQSIKVKGIKMNINIEFVKTKDAKKKMKFF